jgi:hypothetical protein
MVSLFVMEAPVVLVAAPFASVPHMREALADRQ